MEKGPHKCNSCSPHHNSYHSVQNLGNQGQFLVSFARNLVTRWNLEKHLSWVLTVSWGTVQEILATIKHLLAKLSLCDMTAQDCEDHSPCLYQIYRKQKQLVVTRMRTMKLMWFELKFSVSSLTLSKNSSEVLQNARNEKAIWHSTSCTWLSWTKEHHIQAKGRHWENDWEHQIC